MKKRWCVIVVVLSVAGIAAVPLANAQARKGPPRKNGNQGPPSVSVRPPDSRRLRTSLTAPLGWYAGIASNAIPGLTFWEAAAKADGMGLASVEGVSTQKVSADIAKSLDYHLSESEVDAVKHRLAELRLRMPAYYVPSIGPDETSRKVFEFAKSLGVTTIVSTAETASLPALDQLASETGVNLALDARDPKHLAGELQGRSERMGAAADLDAWAKAGIKPADALGVLKRPCDGGELSNAGGPGSERNRALPGGTEPRGGARFAGLALQVHQLFPSAGGTEAGVPAA